MQPLTLRLAEKQAAKVLKAPQDRGGESEFCEPGERGK